MIMWLEAVTYPPSGKQRAAFDVISDLATALTPLDYKKPYGRADN